MRNLASIIIPTSTYCIQSRLHLEEVMRRLANNIETTRGFNLLRRRKDTDKPYQGRISGNRFSMMRVISYRNSFLPIIAGIASRANAGTRVDLVSQLPAVVKIFMSLWLGIMGIGCLLVIGICIIRSRETLDKGFSPTILIPFAMFAFGFLLMKIAFNAEDRKAKDFLLKLLEGEKENAQ